MLKIISLMDNHSQDTTLELEQGFSLYFEQGNRKYLLDAGASDGFMKNAEQMGIDLMQLDAVIISHNHFDHITGLLPLLEYNKNLHVYMKAAAIGNFYFQKKFMKKNISGSVEIFERYHERIHFFEGDTNLFQHVHLCSNVVKDPLYAAEEKALLEKKGNRFVPDDFSHELFVLIEEEEQLILISSCSHAGVVNMVRSANQYLPDKQVTHVVAGFHMMGFGIRPLNCSEEFVLRTAAYLNEAVKTKVHTCHCTGRYAFELMRQQLSDKVTYFGAGQVIEIE